MAGRPKHKARSLLAAKKAMEASAGEAAATETKPVSAAKPQAKPPRVGDGLCTETTAQTVSRLQAVIAHSIKLIEEDFCKLPMAPLSRIEALDKMARCMKTILECAQLEKTVISIQPGNTGLLNGFDISIRASREPGRPPVEGR